MMPTTSTARINRPVAKVRSKVRTDRRCADGRRLISITASAPRASRGGAGAAVARQVAFAYASCDDHGRSGIAQEIGREVGRVVDGALQRARQHDRQPQLM